MQSKHSIIEPYLQPALLIVNLSIDTIFKTNFTDITEKNNALFTLHC
jgi:hypothetical protein